jgi:hypothetical protein
MYGAHPHARDWIGGVKCVCGLNGAGVRIRTVIGGGELKCVWVPWCDVMSSGDATD